MPQNLKARLERIKKVGPPNTPCKAEACDHETSWPQWTEAGFKTLKRTLVKHLSFDIPPAFPPELAILIPDIFRLGRVPRVKELIFFDLETSGLSGGAGTVAFLAAFGRFSSSKTIELTQYLLLDYPGENDFVELTLKEIAAFDPPLLVSYNGKSFDSQILKTRCLMNGITPPEIFNIDLLHPARRLWKGVLNDCSQATIEVSVLGLDRTGDISGAFAPDIWFNFLKNGDNRELLLICDHNARDITGLVSLFSAFTKVAAEPLKAQKKFRFDEEALALFWQEALKRNRLFFKDNEVFQHCVNTGESLLRKAVKNGGQRAALVLALDLFKAAQFREGRLLLQKLIKDDTALGAVRAAAFKALAMDAEWRLEDTGLALEYTAAALELSELRQGQKNELEKRRERLEEKIDKNL